MNVDEAIWFAGVLQRSGRKDSEAEAAPILAAEIERLRAELDKTKGVRDHWFARLTQVDKELAAAKAASVVPVEIR
jgi:hypothetical protein